MSHPKADALLKQIQDFIAAAKVHLAEGGHVDLAGLDGQVRELCDMITAMTLNDNKFYREALAVLSSDLGVLRDDMVQVQSQVREDIDRLNLRSKAAKAYQTSEKVKPRSTPEPKPEEGE